MIIRIIATALAQCIARTQAGWTTFAGLCAMWSSVTVRVDMAAPFFHPSLAIIRQGPGFRYQPPAYGNNAFGLCRSQKGEPGHPGSLVAHPAVGRNGRAGAP